MGSAAGTSSTATGTVPNGSITLAVIDSAGATVSKVTFAGQTLQASYFNTEGAPLKGVRIAFTVTSGTGVVLGSDSALTNELGVASIVVRASGSSVSGVATVSASADNVTSAVSFVLSPEGSDVLSLALLNANGGSTSSVSYAGGQKIRAAYTDASGRPLAGRVVNFAISYGSGAVLGSASALTDASGYAVIGVDATDTKISGAVSVTATSTSATGVLNFRILGGASSSLGLYLVDSAGNRSTSVGYQTGHRIRAVYRDETGSPIANTTVSFKVSKGDMGTTLAAGSALTDANGVAYVAISSSGPGAAGAATVVASAGSSSASIDFAVTADGSPTLVLVLLNSSSGSVPTVSFGGGQRIRAQYLDARGGAIANALVKFSTGASTDATVVGAGITDKDGYAYADIAPASATAAGGVTVQAYVGTVVGMLNVQIKTKAAGLNRLTLSVLDRNRQLLASPAISFNGGQLIKALYQDSDGSPIAFTTVSFVVTKGAAGTALQTSSGLTDADGAVYVGINPVDPTVSGAATVTATAGGATSTVDFAVNAQGNPTLTLTLEGSASAVVPTVSFGGGQRIKAVYKASDGSPIANTVVKFSSSSPADLTIVSSALTNDKGEAWIEVSPASATTAGAATVTAWVNNVVAIVNVSIKTPVQMPNVLSLELSESNGASASSSALKFGANQVLRFKYTKGDGSAIAGVRVTFAVSAGQSLATLLAESALTDANGVASVAINSSGAVAVGAATATASVTVGTSVLSTSLDFAVTSVAVTLSPLSLGSQTLAAGATTAVSINATASGQAVSAVPISLTADCGVLSPSIALTNGSGQASSTYSSLKSDGTSCSGVVKITATASGATRNASLSVTAPVAAAVNFMSASPAAIYVQGSGASTQATLKFKVLDALGIAFPNASIAASITTNPGGVGLGSTGATAPLTLSSDSTGVVSLQIYAGTVPGPVQVKVSLNESTYAYSNNITVQSGPPAQDRFSLSAATSNIEGQDIDGTPTKLTIRVADRQGNAVPDGTVINFTSGGGQIEPSCATIKVNGISFCSVNFSSQQPRPASQYSRVPVLAFAEGVKVYKDKNGNNSFDYGTDTLTDMGDAYRDDNENGRYDEGEFLLPRGGVGVCPSSAWGTPARADTCSSQTAATTVRSQIVLLMASSRAELNLLTASATAMSFRVNSVTPCADGSKCLPMASGTTLTVTTSNPSECTATAPVPNVVGNIQPTSNLNDQLGSVHAVLLTAAEGKTCTGKRLSVTVTSPSGAVTTTGFDIR